MGYSKVFLTLVEDRLGALVPIRTKAMFGGIGIYSGDSFFALIADEQLYFKVDDSNRADFEAAGMGPFFPFDSPKPMGYWQVPPRLLDEPEELKVWIDKALHVAASKKKR